jgi:hypothetical protein
MLDAMLAFNLEEDLAQAAVPGGKDDTGDPRRRGQQWTADGYARMPAKTEP